MNVLPQVSSYSSGENNQQQQQQKYTLRKQTVLMKEGKVKKADNDGEAGDLIEWLGKDSLRWWYLNS